MQRNVNYIDVKNLTPDTEYFLYVVLQGEQGGAISPQTLLYKFKTQEEDPFYIKLDLTNPIVSILPSKDATVNYILVPYESTSLDERLTDSIRDHLADGVDDSLVDEMTVLDAMNTDVSVGNVSQGSVFDLYADPAFKNEMDGYIRRGDLGAASIVGGKSGVNITNGELPVDCTELGQLSEGVKYAFLVSGRVLGDPSSTPVFRSIYPVYLSGGVAPMVRTITPSRFSESDTNRRFTISFDKPLYYYDGTTDPPTKKAVDRGPLGLVTRRDSFISVRDLLQSESGLSVMTDRNQVNKNTTILEVKIDNLRDGAQLTFNSNLSDEYGHNRAIPPLQIFLRKVVDENGDTFYDVKIPPEWDQNKLYSN